jgi:hypothetical protein
MPLRYAPANGVITVNFGSLRDLTVSAPFTYVGGQRFLAVFAGDGRPYFERHRIRSGEQRITLTVSRKPEGVGVDPYHNLIQRVKDGKVVGLEEPGTSPWTAEYRARRYDSTRVKIPLPNF